MTAFRKILIQISSNTVLGILPLLVGILVALVAILLILNNENVEPRAVYDLIYDRTLSLPENRANVVDFWLPILLCCCGLLLTFTAGLWNIGIEGQITMGAVGATSIALFVELPRNEQIFTELFMAGAAGGVWALFTGIMRTRGGVNEIFGGVAMNFLASSFSSYLLVAPWSPPNATGSATVRFPANAILPSMDDYRLSPITIYITLTAFIFVLLTLSGSRWGLQLRAMGKNEKSAQMLGVPTERNIWLAMLICGIMAGLAGGHLVLFRRANLPANVSGGIGFLSLLVVLLASIRVRWVPFVSFAFALLYSAGLPLRTRLQLDASLIGIFLGILVFCVLIFDGVRQRLKERVEQRKLLAASGGEKSPPPPTVEIQIGQEASSGPGSN